MSWLHRFAAMLFFLIFFQTSPYDMMVTMKWLEEMKKAHGRKRMLPWHSFRPFGDKPTMPPCSFFKMFFQTSPYDMMVTMKRLEEIKKRTRPQTDATDGTLVIPFGANLTMPPAMLPWHSFRPFGDKPTMPSLKTRQSRLCFIFECSFFF